MRILLDHCVPGRFAELLTGHDVSLARDQGWDKLRNGVLLARATDDGFELIVTVDANLVHQQNLATLPMSIVLVRATSNRLKDLRPLGPEVLRAIGSIKPRTWVQVGTIPASRTKRGAKKK